MVETNSADAAREAEFNEWYDKIHLPDVLENAGLVRATRYENTEPSEEKAKFLTVYEIETGDIDGVMKTLNDNMARKKAEGPVQRAGRGGVTGSLQTDQLPVPVSPEFVRKYRYGYGFH